jgi:hypothetical protein
VEPSCSADSGEILYHENEKRESAAELAHTGGRWTRDSDPGLVIVAILFSIDERLNAFGGGAGEVVKGDRFSVTPMYYEALEATSRATRPDFSLTPTFPC